MKQNMNPGLEEIKNTIAANTPKPIGKYRYYAVLVPLVHVGDGATIHNFEGANSSCGQTINPDSARTNSADEFDILFEVRSDSLRKQPGEIGLPGGKIEPGETPADCAVRETTEELGIPASAITLLGELNYIHAYSNFTMYSFAGEIDPAALMRAEINKDEVKEIFRVPLRFFLENDPLVYVNEIAPVVNSALPLGKIRANDGYSWRHGTADVPIYTWKPAQGEERVIWGLTARLIYDFAQMLRTEISAYS